MNAIVNKNFKITQFSQRSNDWDDYLDDEDEDLDDFDDDSDEKVQKKKKVRRKVKQTETLEVERRYLILNSDGTYKEANSPGGMKHWMIGSDEKISAAKKRLGL